MEFLPDAIANSKFFEPSSNPSEERMRQFLKQNWKEKYGY